MTVHLLCKSQALCRHEQKEVFGQTAENIYDNFNWQNWSYNCSLICDKHQLNTDRLESLMNLWL